MIKAAFFDVDGTLLSHKTRQVPPSARRAVEKLKEQGILCIVATGRQISEMKKLPIADMEFDGYLTLNGQLMLDAGENILFSKPITGKVKEFLLRQFESQEYPALLVEEKTTYLNFVNDHVRATQTAISSAVPPLGTYSGGEIYQVCAYLQPGEEYHLAPIAEDCVITRWHFGGMDVVAKGGGKVSGIRRFLEMTGIDQSEIIAFGDGENDVEMLSFAGIGVAMGNAVDAAKAVGDYVNADIDDDGIEKALKHYKLI